MVKLDPGDARTPVLQWYYIDRLGQDGGELLAAFELIKVRFSGESFFFCFLFLLYCSVFLHRETHMLYYNKSQMRTM